jgi:hypothetical protein
VLVPLARANASDAVKLAAHLERESMSTRELMLFYGHYQKSNRQVRERMLQSPGLFIRSSQALNGSKDESPEERWLHDAKVVCAILDRMREKAETVFYPHQEKKTATATAGPGGQSPTIDRGVAAQNQGAS